MPLLADKGRGLAIRGDSETVGMAVSIRQLDSFLRAQIHSENVVIKWVAGRCEKQNVFPIRQENGVAKDGTVPWLVLDVRLEHAPGFRRLLQGIDCNGLGV